MALKSCGILLYRVNENTHEYEVFLVQANVPNSFPELWGVPKGRMERGEKPLQTAKREFGEETGTTAPDLEYLPLPPFVTKRGKTIIVFTADAEDYPVHWIRKNVAVTKVMRNGQVRHYKETRDGRWFPLSKALEQIGAGQKGILELLQNQLVKANI